MEEKIIVSFSGGRTSAFMATLMLQNYNRQDLVFVFANTGKENKETLDFINKCDLAWQLNVVWLEALVNPEKGKGTTYKLVSYETASRNGEPFADVNKKYGIPNKNQPHCTRELKEAPIKKYAKETFGKNYKMAIGIRIDEAGRINRLRAEKYNWIYPLADDFPTTKKMVSNFWSKQPFDLSIPDYLGNCDLCWKKSKKKRLRILSENPSIGDWWQGEEEKDEYVFDRDGIPIKKLKLIAQEQKKQLSLFDFKSEKQCNCFSNVT